MNVSDIPPSDQDRLAAFLRDAIFEQRLRPGQTVIEKHWSSSLGVGRASVRLAIRTLIVEGLLVRAAGGGIRVPEYSRTGIRDYSTELLKAAVFSGRLCPGTCVVSTEWAHEHELPEPCVQESLDLLTEQGFLVRGADQLPHVPLYTSEEIVSVYQIRARLEGLAARLAVAAHADLTPVETALASMEAAVKNAHARNAIESELAFHLALGSASGNAVLGESLNRLLRPLFVFIQLRAIGMSARTCWPDLERHQQMLCLLQEGGAAAAGQFVERSIQQLESAALLLCEYD